MLVKELFNKKIDRAINGVVKADQTANETAFVELSEYVITKELDGHFNHFFNLYMPSVHDPKGKAVSGKLGIWVSGFFGSGKSHFIKILSYLLQNKLAYDPDGAKHTATDFFREKINDNFLMSEIDTAVAKDNTVILFNIDTRADTDDAENAVLKVLLKVFNERCGFSGDHPHIAHLERDLESRGLLDAFKVGFAEVAGVEWEAERDSYDFYRDDMSAALAKVTQQSETSTRTWMEGIEKNFPLDITNFCKWVKEYLDVDSDRRIIFFIDEIGQFLGQNTQMMLKLQSITESLGTICEGRAWIVVTSQEDMDTVLGGMQSSKKQDFSKIQGRFERISLSSSNTNEVIEKRLLSKTDEAKTELAALYAQKGDILKNQLSFDQTTTAELSSYKDADAFVQSYPFIPYHYSLVQKIFEAIRKAGATGLHLSRGERSLLDAFQSAAKQVQDQPIGVLIPLYAFYPAIESFLDTGVKRDIQEAGDRESITDFSVELLKALFLIRYVDLVKATLDNLVTLCVTRIDDDKLALRKQIENSLNALEQNLLVARQGDEYIFLTNEEKEIEAEIQNTDIELSDETNTLSTIIFDEVLRRNHTYRYPENNQDFPISRFCNGVPKDGAHLNDLVLRFVSEIDPGYEAHTTAECTKQSTDKDGSIIFKLPKKPLVFKELQTYIKTAKYLRMKDGQNQDQEVLLRSKSIENSNRHKKIIVEIETLVGDAEIYALGSEQNPKGSKLAAVMDDVYRYVIENSFGKLKLIRPYSGNITQEIQSVLAADDAGQIGLNLKDSGANPQASLEVDKHIGLSDDFGRPVTADDVVRKFSLRPYGWKDEETILILTRLALANKITFSSRQQPVPLRQSYEHLMQVRKRADLRLHKVKQQSEANLKATGRLYRDVFSGNAPDNEKVLFESAREHLKKWRGHLRDFKSRASTGHFPGKQAIEDGLVLISGLLEMKDSYSFIERFLDAKNDLLDFEEDYQDLENFYHSQFDTWQKLELSVQQRFARNRQFLEQDETARTALGQLNAIYKDPRPYRDIRQVEPLIEQVAVVNQALLADERELAAGRLNVARQRVEDHVKAFGIDAAISNKSLRPFHQAIERIQGYDAMADIRQEMNSSDDLEQTSYELINRYIADQKATKQREVDEALKRQAAAELTAKKAGEAYTKPKPVIDKPIIAEPRVKAVRTLAPAAIFERLSGSGFIETEADVEQYLTALREQLSKALADDFKVRIR